MRRIVPALVVFLGMIPGAVGDSTVTIRCDDPQGQDIRYGPPLLSEGSARLKTDEAERFGSAQLFVWSENKPGELTVIWGSYVLETLDADHVRDLGLKAEAVQASIVVHDNRKITAIERRQHTVYMYSLYPDLGYGIFTQHKYGNVTGGADAWTYYGPCHFSGTIR